MRARQAALLLIAPMILLLSIAAPARGQTCTSSPLAQWTVVSGGNGHFYQVVCAPRTQAGPGLIGWGEAGAQAARRGGYLATLTSSAENDFAAALANQPDYWSSIGGSNLGPWIGLSRPLPCGSAPFAWVTGEAFGFFKWATGEPNCDETAEHLAHFYTCCTGARGSTWNDTRDQGLRAYVVELDTLTVPPTLGQELFVTNRDASSVTVFSDTADGNASPARTLEGGMTGMSQPHGIALDTVNNEVAVANFQANTVTVSGLGAGGEVPPIRTLSGVATQLDLPQGIAIDTVNDELVVVNRSSISTPGNAKITVYPRTASGPAVPVRVLSGALTTLSYAHGLAVDTVHDEILVVNTTVPPTAPGAPSIAVFTRTANGEMTPIRRIQGTATLLDAPIGLALDLVNDEILVANGGSSNSITVYSRTASGNAVPKRVISGASTGMASPAGLAVDTVNDEVAVAGLATQSVPVFDRRAAGDAQPPPDAERRGHDAERAGLCRPAGHLQPDQLPARPEPGGRRHRSSLLRPELRRREHQAGDPLLLRRFGGQPHLSPLGALRGLRRTPDRQLDGRGDAPRRCLELRAGHVLLPGAGSAGGRREHGRVHGEQALRPGGHPLLRRHEPGRLPGGRDRRRHSPVEHGPPPGDRDPDRR